MKLREAWDIIIRGEKPKGYRVHFETHESGMLKSDYFPDRNEKMFVSENEAWNMAYDFANATKARGRYVNIYVVDDEWRPTWKDWDSRKILNRWDVS